ncbi:MAG: anti-sigma factor [Granulosicoccus sp.]|nr:anti-sigma factor [Granulosicoccus sp.]
MNSPDEEWWDLQAGEYVIGTLSLAERTTFAKLVESDPDALRRVVWWETRLAHLDRDVVPVDPPAAVWQGIQQRLQHGNTRQSATQVADLAEASRRIRDQQQSLSVWRGFAALASAACLVLAITLWTQQSDRPGSGEIVALSYDGISIITDSDNRPLWVIDASVSDKKLRITTVGLPDTQPDKSFELWMVKANDQGVSSMGLLPLEVAQSVIINTPTFKEDGVAFAVSLEPTGGSPEAVPTGPVLYSGPIQKLSSVDSI